MSLVNRKCSIPNFWMKYLGKPFEILEHFYCLISWNTYSLYLCFLARFFKKSPRAYIDHHLTQIILYRYPTQLISQPLKTFQFPWPTSLKRKNKRKIKAKDHVCANTYSAMSSLPQVRFPLKSQQATAIKATDSSPQEFVWLQHVNHD